MKTEDCYVVLASGRRLRATGGVLGLGFNGGLTGGYDEYIALEDDDGDDSPLTNAERAEIAYAMVARWKAWGEP